MTWEKEFASSDSFMIEKWLTRDEQEEWQQCKAVAEKSDNLRKKAYEHLYSKIKNKKIASKSTIQNWFGIGKVSKMRRNHVFLLALALSFSVEEIEEYLNKGIYEPGIQINDYKEVIYMYGVENHLSIEECEDMIFFFEKSMQKDYVIEQRTHSLELWNKYSETKGEDREVFLLWMIQNAGMFKGYSRVSLKRFIELKKVILTYVREDARTQLMRLLEETNFFEWAEANHISKEAYGDNIKRYIRNISRQTKNGLTDELKNVITELGWMAYSSKDKNTDLLSELYAAAVVREDAPRMRHQNRRKYHLRDKFRIPSNLSFMTDKYVSQLIGVAEQKERQLHLIQAIARSDSESEQRELKKKLVEQNKRCHLVQREDLLPLIHYIAQRQYFDEIGGDITKYQREDAKNKFVIMTNRILEECQMAPLSDSYQLDYWLLCSYQNTDMYSLSDMIEECMLG